MNYFNFTVDKKLVNDPIIHAILLEKYKDDLPRIMKGIEKGQKDIVDDVWDFLLDVIKDGSEVVDDSIDGAAPDNDVFGVNIMNLGPLYWIQACEFDDIGTFDSLEDAISAAECKFGTYIEVLEEREK